MSNSNRTISKATEMLYSLLNDKLTNVATAYKAKIWQPKALLIKTLSVNMIAYIEKLKDDLKKEAGLISESANLEFNERDRKAVDRLFNIKGKGSELYERLKNYKEDMLAIDSQMSSVFGNAIVLTSQSFDTLQVNKQDIIKTFFEHTQPVEALALLNLFQNNIKNIENRMVEFCSNKITSYSDGYFMYSAIVVQSSSIVKAGEKIEITAGIGAFSKIAMQEIIINGKNIPLGVDGTSIYKFNASGKPGKHYVPVKIEFVDQDGKKQTMEKNVEYTVVGETDHFQ